MSPMDDTYTVCNMHVFPTMQALNYKKYSSASDVWSFGALMYEIWSLGHKPFEKYSNIEVRQLISK